MPEGMKYVTDGEILDFYDDFGSSNLPIRRRARRKKNSRKIKYIRRKIGRHTRRLRRGARRIASTAKGIRTHAKGAMVRFKTKTGKIVKFFRKRK